MRKMKTWVVTYRAVRTAHEEIWIEKEVQDVEQKIEDAYARTEARNLLEKKYKSKNPVIQILNVSIYGPFYKWRWISPAKVEATVFLREEEMVEITSFTKFGARFKATHQLEGKGLKDIIVTSVDRVIKV